MKRRISLIIAFALSFLMIFGSIARAEEIKVPISVSPSEPTQLEITIKVPSAETNKADCSPLQEKASQLDEHEVGVKCNECLTFSGKPGRCMQIGDILCAYCQPCEVRGYCDCETAEGGPGWRVRVGSEIRCIKCGSY